MTTSVTAAGPGWLFVPADRPERYAKAIEASDLAIIDLEDAVRPADKDTARELLLSSALDPERVCVRVNGFGTTHVDSDLDAVRERGITRVMVPMAEADHPFESLTGLEVIALIETARGVIEADRIAAHQQVGALALGSADLALNLRTRSAENSTVPASDPLAYARTRILYAARAYGLPVIDSVHTTVDDDSGLRGEADAAAAQGFDGKLAIHPRQIDPIRSAFAPRAEELDWAQSVMSEARSRSTGAFVLDGELVDEVIIRRAEMLLAHGS